ncbi:unnamed protein product [Darwinula stevensoni]|uniref:Uncharacterized protein n=1 Tax=Darwinula stevensoni TaxID=69355 RepID=A0A7R8XDI7_9CRUS|nr:unnamed protein product [Darwinula stevensoni]CAG0894382.1 unnamed protein product [Darwinula stevensoni]
MEGFNPFSVGVDLINAPILVRVKWKTDIYTTKSTIKAELRKQIIKAFECIPTNLRAKAPYLPLKCSHQPPQGENDHRTSTGIRRQPYWFDVVYHETAETSPLCYVKTQTVRRLAR